jgi:hypothetical protein
VFERGSSAVFGPVATYGANSTGGVLCEDMFNKVSTNSLMGHVRRGWTTQLQAMSIVQNDRL